MKTLIWKEFREYRFHLLLMMLFGIGSVGLLVYNTMFDRDTLTTLLLVLANPVFILLFSQNSVAGEINSGTFPFLAGLPLPRARVWLAKLVSLILFAAALTGFFAGLVLLTGESPLMKYLTFLRNLPPLSPLFLMVGLPLSMIAIGFFASMLPGAPTVAVLTGTVLVFVATYLSQSLGALNFTVLTPLFILSFLAASYQAFVRGELMQGWKPILAGWGTILVCALLSTMVWAGLDLLADQLPGKEAVRIVTLQQRDPSGPILGHLRSTPAWWDPIDDKLHSWAAVIDPETGAMHKIGPRGSYAGPISEAQSAMAMVSGYRFPGYLSTPRLILFDLKLNRPREIVDASAHPICFLPDGSLLYERRIETTPAPLFGYQTGKSLPDIVELCRFKSGEKRHVLGSWSGSSLRTQPLIDRNQAVIDTIGAGNNLLIDLESGKATRLAASESLFLVARPDNRAIFRLGHSWSSTGGQFVELTREGELIPLSWIPTGTTILEYDSPKPLAWRRVMRDWDSDRQNYSYHQDTLTRLDFSANTITVLQEKTDLFIADIYPAKSQDTWLLMKTRNGVFRMDHQTGTLEPVPSAPKCIEDVQPLGKDRFLILCDPQGAGENGGQSLWTLDLKTGETRKL